MATKIFTTQFKTFLIKKIIDSNPIFYMYLGKHTPFVNDSIPSTPTDSTQDFYVGAFDNMIVAKAIKPADLSYMIPRVDWTQGNGYQAYRAGNAVRSNTSYVSVQSASGVDVFKCLSNNGASIYPPNLNNTSANDAIYETADGYQWKYMYSISQDTFDKFATRDFIPVFSQPEVVASAVDGAIDYVDVVYGGSNYDGFTSGTFQTVTVGGNSQIFAIESTASSNNSFYVGSAIKVTQGTGAGQMRTITGYSVSGSTRNVVVNEPFTVQPTTTSSYEITPRVVVAGSGTGFQGRALVNAAASNTVYKVEIVDRGQSYYYGTAQVVGNTGGTTNTAILSVVIGPKNGHGYDPIDELGSQHLCLTSTFDGTDTTANTKIVDVNAFRNVGVIVNPQLANVSILYTAASGIFNVGDTVTQQGTGATGIIKQDNTNSGSMLLTNVHGSFLTGNLSSHYITSNSGISAAINEVHNNGSDPLTDVVDYVNCTTRLDIIDVAGTFAINDTVRFDGNTSTSAVVYYANTSQLWLTNVRGNIGSFVASNTASANVATVWQPDFIHGSGQVLYMENISPINRMPGQTETKKIIIEF